MANTALQSDIDSDATIPAPIILIVEDEVLLRMAAADFLEDFGFNVLQVGSADEALEIFHRRFPHIDLVFTDIRMPGAMDGFALTKWIRENRPGTPVILASGQSGRINVGEELAAGEPFLPKPYDFDLLVVQIRRMLAARKSAPVH